MFVLENIEDDCTSILLIYCGSGLLFYLEKNIKKHN